VEGRVGHAGDNEAAGEVGDGVGTKERTDCDAVLFSTREERKGPFEADGRRRDEAEGRKRSRRSWVPEMVHCRTAPILDRGAGAGVDDRLQEKTGTVTPRVSQERVEEEWEGEREVRGG
jgi:hypothetical protein